MKSPQSLFPISKTLLELPLPEDRELERLSAQIPSNLKKYLTSPRIVSYTLHHWVPVEEENPFHLEHCRRNQAPQYKEIWHG
jgi:hypothetical protein